MRRLALVLSVLGGVACAGSAVAPPAAPVAPAGASAPAAAPVAATGPSTAATKLRTAFGITEYELANGLPFGSFLREAPTEAGVYGDHLRGILKAVEDHPELEEALRQVVNSTEPVKLRSELAFKLESLGVLVPEGNMERPRCSLYSTYLADRLAS